MQKIIIIGASKGIGRALAIQYAKQGADLYLIARNEDELSELCRIISLMGCKAYYYACDVSNKGGLIAALEDANARLTKIDMAVINAGINMADSYLDYSSDTIKRIFEVNIFGLSYILEYLIPYMKRQGYGKIVGFGSLADVRGFPGNASYCASKIAIFRILEGARIQLKQYGIEVITVKPGFVATQMTKNIKYYLPFLLTSEQSAKTIIRSIEKGKKRIYFPFPTFLMSQIIGLLPARIYENVMIKINKVFY